MLKDAAHLPHQDLQMRALSIRLGAFASLLLVASCDNGVTAPAPAPSSGVANRSLLGPATVTVVTRNTPLATAQSASAMIGLLGGQLSIPGAGLKVIVPPFALRSWTRITVTAVAGNQLAYEFEPHGIRFLVPLLVSQNLTGTSALNGGGLLPKPVIAGYFADLSDLDPLGGTALVSELLGTSVSLLTKTATFPIFHFSGYLVATGEGSTSSIESAQ
jgi:hypothetical protein